MDISFGTRLKNIRKEREFTQRELAELIGVSTQTVSKWENNIRMPDISQIVPLARVLCVSTDILLGFSADKENEDVIKIINEARTEKAQYRVYCKLLEARRKYPNNIILLLEILERSAAIAYPENDCYDPAHATEVYGNCESISKTVMSYATNASDILRARMIMVILHAAYGNYEKAAEHLPHFPCRVDMTQNNMTAYIAHLRGDYRKEISARKWDLLYIYEGMMDCMATLGKAYMENKEYEKAIATFKTAIDIAEQTFKDEKYIPPLHRRDCGDVYYMLAKAYIALNDAENALSSLEKLCDSIKLSSKVFDGSYKLATPLFDDIPVKWYCRLKVKREDTEKISNLLKERIFDDFRENERYLKLTEEIENELFYE